MPLTDHERNGIISRLDQEEAAIREMLDCEEYRLLMLRQVSGGISQLNEAMKDENASPEMKCFLEWNLIDAIALMRIAQAYLCQYLLKEDEYEDHG